jgi:hypothetical protein
VAIPQVAGPFFLSRLLTSDMLSRGVLYLLVVAFPQMPIGRMADRLVFFPPYGQMLVQRQQFLYSVAKNEWHINVAEVDERASRTVG